MLKIISASEARELLNTRNARELLDSMDLASKFVVEQIWKEICVSAHGNLLITFSNLAVKTQATSPGIESLWDDFFETEETRISELEYFFKELGYGTYTLPKQLGLLW